MASRIRTFRIDDELYTWATNIAELQGVSVSQIIRDAVGNYLRTLP
jgi:antitoxin component of RelBE/YafQ-DinJ toxin-antitoxin module